MKTKKDNALLFSGASTGLNNFVVATTPETEEFRNSSPRVIVSTLTKNSRVEKYVDNTSVCAVKNHIIRLADHRGVVVNAVKSGESFSFLNDVLDKGNYLARAN